MRKKTIYLEFFISYINFSLEFFMRSEYTMSENKIYEVLFHARGGMGAVTAAELLCDMAFQEVFEMCSLCL